MHRLLVTLTGELSRFFDFCDATKTQRVPYYYTKDTVKCPVLYNGITSVKPVDWTADPFQICAETGCVNQCVMASPS